MTGDSSVSIQSIWHPQKKSRRKITLYDSSDVKTLQDFLDSRLQRRKMKTSDSNMSAFISFISVWWDRNMIYLQDKKKSGCGSSAKFFAVFFAACAAALLLWYKVCCKTDKRQICPAVPDPRIHIIVSQRGGWEGHAHSHFSWCVRKISSMTQRTFGLRWRWYRVTSGAYFSTSCSLIAVLEAWQVQPLFQLLVPQPQFPPQRLTRRHRGKKTALVALSSSRRFTE